MLLVISPAKTLDFDTPAKTERFSQPDFLADSQLLIDRARMYSALDIMEVMQVSMKIAELNVDRFANWHTPFSSENAKQAVLAFKGDVYTGLEAETFAEDDFIFAQEHLRILSGLYGLLKPLDLMQAYRLEMGRKVDNPRGKNLYEFWGELITEALNKQLQQLGSNYLINLASSEYFKSVKPKVLKGEVITPEFKDWKNGQYKMMGVYAKKARGQLSRYVIQNKLTEPEAMKAFNVDGYRYNDELSTEIKYVFTRKQ